jgi:hypothetical protein
MRSLAFRLAVGLLGLCTATLAAEESRRVLAVNVIDREGHQVSTLSAVNFRGKVRGDQVRIDSAVFDTSPRRVALVIDTSVSVVGEEAALQWRVAQDLVADLAPGHAIAVFALGRELRELRGPTNDPRLLLATLAQARATAPAGPSALHDGVVEASRSFATPGFADVVCLVTDGEDTASRLSPREAERAVGETGARVFVVLVRRIGGAAQPRVAFSQAENWTRSIAEATGGAVVKPDDRGAVEFVKRLQRLKALIRQVYRLEVDLPARTDGSPKLDLEVVDGGGRKMKVELVYPRLLVPASGK